METLEQLYKVRDREHQIEELEKGKGCPETAVPDRFVYSHISCWLKFYRAYHIINEGQEQQAEKTSP